jgi:hypothetical protein
MNRNYMIVLSTLAFAMVILVAPEQADALQAGTAKTDITPPIGGSMYGYGARGENVSQGVHDPLYAKAVVLEHDGNIIAWVTLDLGTFTHENTANVKELVKKQTGIDQLICTASHTHSAPGTQDDFPSAEKSYLREMEKKIADTVEKAKSKMKPAQIKAGKGYVKEGHNRRLINPDGNAEMMWGNRARIATSPVDYSVGVIRIETPKGKNISTLVNYQTHPVVLGPENLLISADYPGYMMEKVEKALGGQCQFIQGAAGDINPFWDKTPPEEGAFEQAEKMGLAIADEVIRLSNSTYMTLVNGEPTLSFNSETIMLADRKDRERSDLKYDAEVNTVVIGSDIALATFPGEFFVQHGLRLKEASRIKNTFFAGYSNGRLRYFPTIQAVTEGGYGAASATIVEVGAGEHLVNRALINIHYQADLVKP